MPTHRDSEQPRGSDYQQQLNEMKQSYIASLPERLQELSRAWAGFSRSPTAETQKKLYHQAHNLAGSGASFDQPEISRLARDLQNALRHLSLKSPEQQQQDDLQHALSRLIEHCESVIRNSQCRHH